MAPSASDICTANTNFESESPCYVRVSKMSAIPILDLAQASDPSHHESVLAQLHSALFNVGFLYVKNHGIPQTTIDDLIDMLPKLFNLPPEDKLATSKLNSPHFLGYNGYAEESTLGQKDLREQFDFATELPVIYDEDKNKHDNESRDFSKQYWRLRGPNQWPNEQLLPGFRDVLNKYVQLHLIMLSQTERVIDVTMK